jgi:hypothetical protein
MFVLLRLTLVPEPFGQRDNYNYRDECAKTVRRRREPARSLVK